MKNTDDLYLKNKIQVLKEEIYKLLDNDANNIEKALMLSMELDKYIIEYQKKCYRQCISKGSNSKKS